jgi:YD repeat-containing protein
MDPHNLCPRCGSLMADGPWAACGDSGASPIVHASSSAKGPSLKVAIIGFVVYAVLCIVAVTFFRHRILRHLGNAMSLQSPAQPGYPSHNGPVAQLDELKGSGTIYLVQMGDHKTPYSLEDFAQWLRTKYKLDVKVLPPTSMDRTAWNQSRGQYVAESLYMQLKREHPDLAASPNAYLIGFTDADMYTTQHLWRSTFTERDLKRSAIISADGMEDIPREKTHFGAAKANQRFQARLRRILLKDVAILYWGLPVNNDRTSLLHNTLDPDLPTEDIYESDLDPARTARGQVVDEPCVFLEYSAHWGVRHMPGPSIQGCADAADPDDDTSVERFEVDLRIGLLIDKRTDFYLPDTIPIQFQRVTRDGWRGPASFGMSGTNNYDEFLSSADNITIGVVHADGGSDSLVREPRDVPILSLVKYVDTHDRPFNEMRWAASPFEHYSLNRFDGAVETYLPCDGPSIHCYLTGYRSPQGEELKFERGGNNRRLLSLTSPHQRLIQINYDGAGRISDITDSCGRTVRYGYDTGGRLTNVTYPSGEVCSYTYDSTQHLLTFSASADGKAPSRVLMHNEYLNGLLSKQTLADGAVYEYSYALDEKEPSVIRGATVKTPDGRVFDLSIQERASVAHERTTAAGSPAPHPIQ